MILRLQSKPFGHRGVKYLESSKLFFKVLYLNSFAEVVLKMSTFNCYINDIILNKKVMLVYVVTR